MKYMIAPIRNNGDTNVNGVENHVKTSTAAKYKAFQLSLSSLIMHVISS